MPKGDIRLPNVSGTVDPRLARHAETERSRSFHRTEQSRTRKAEGKKSPARRAYEGLRALMRSR